jgi:lipoprotein-anchoring transpeptidase ErfK/SrfK
MRIIIAPLVFGWGCFMSRVLTRAVLFVVMITAGAMLAAVAAHPATHNIVTVSGYEPGTIVVKTGERRLLYVIDRSRALRFPVGVGREGQQWTGRAKVEGKYIEPAWAPPEVIRRDHPDLPKVIPGGSPRNPMGAAALTLRGGEYAIHGTNNPGSIGGFVSYGCIRMRNADIKTLYRLVDVGTPVIVEQ